MNVFAERLKELRTDKNLSQDELARETGISQAGIAYLEAGKRQPTAQTVIVFAKFFGVSADYLLGLSND